MTYLDTNVVLWLASGNFDKLSAVAKKSIQEAVVLLVSPIVALELQYLFEIKKINHTPNVILKKLHEAIGLKQCEVQFLKLVNQALDYSWTRDPFDRLITANAACYEAPLITSNKVISRNYSYVLW